MNGRLYDPLLRRFLNADENIQDVFNTQNYNKYGYVLNNPLMYNDPSGEFLFIPVLIFTLATVSQAVMIASLLYLGTAIITGNASNAGFLKTIGKAALTSFFIGGNSSNVFGPGLFSALVSGAITGAVSGGVAAIIDGNNFLKGVYTGASYGAAFAGITYSINYFVKGYNKPQYTTTDDVNVGNNNTIADQQTMQENIKNARSNFTPEEISSYKIESETVGLSDSNGLMLNSGDGKFNVLGETKLAFGSGKSTIAYSTKAASNTQILGRVMAHETAHAYSFALGLPNIDIEPTRRLDSSLNSVEHITIRKLEHIYANKNYILSNYWKNGYMDMDVINMTLKALRPNELFLYNYSYNKFLPIFNRTFKFP